MKISFFDSARDNAPRQKELTWNELANLLITHKPSKMDKLNTPAFSPAEFLDGATRSKDAVVALHAATLDLDKISEVQLAEVLERSQKYTQIFYTTWSHADNYEKDGTYCARLVLQVSRPVLPHEWKSFWLRLNAQLGGYADEKCTDPARIYFLPWVPTLDHALASSSALSDNTHPVDVDALLRSHLPETKIEIVPQEIQKNLITLKNLEGLAQRLQRSKSGAFADLGARLEQALKGEAFARSGERDDIMFRLACQIAESFPEGRWEEFPNIFKEAFSNLGPDAPTLETFLQKIVRRQLEVAQEKQKQKVQEEQEAKLRNRIAFRSERDYPYTSHEIETFAKQQQCTIEEFQKRWVINFCSSFYFYRAGSYTPAIPEGNIPNAALQFLAPAASVGVTPYFYTEKGEKKLKTQSQLLEEYGTLAGGVSVDLTAQHSFYDSQTETFCEAPCPLRQIAPEYDSDVDAWLKAMAGEHVEKLLDWVATVTDLQHPSAALYLQGIPGAGKTLLAIGLARLWTTGEPTALNHALANFNEDLTRCPLVLVDEVLPENMRREGTTGDLRQFIQATSRALSRKFKPNATLKGAVRLIIAANNMDLFETSENLSINDRRAVGERLLYIPVREEGRTFLENLEKKSGLVNEDRIARHALWLRDHRTVKRGKRFLVEGQDSDLHRHMAVSMGMTSATCHWLVLFLQDKGKMYVGAQEKLIRIWKGKIFVRAKALTSKWEIYPTNTRPPTGAQVSKALASISECKKQLRDSGVQTEYWVVKTEHLITWATTKGFASEEEILSALSNDSDNDAIEEEMGKIISLKN